MPTNQWISDSYVASIAFSHASGLVEAKWFMDNVPIEQSVFDTDLEWATDSAYASVVLDSHDRVIVAGCDPCIKVEQGRLDNLFWHVPSVSGNAGSRDRRVPCVGRICSWR